MIAEGGIGTQTGEERNKWYNEECRDEVNKSNEPWIKIIQWTRWKVGELEREQWIAKYLWKYIKWENLDAQLKMIQELHDTKETRKVL